MTNLIDERDERTRERKKKKKKMDELIGLSFSKEQGYVNLHAKKHELSSSTARLLDEGYIDNGFIIKKGTMEKFLNGENQYVRGYKFVDGDYAQTEVLNLDDDFVGTVNLGHMDFSTFPYELGSWTKDDLTLVDIGNDRKAINVNLNLDEDSLFIRELKRQSYDVGISAEFWAHTNEEDTEEISELLGTYMPVFDEIYIFAYGIVGECGNVNSSGVELKGGKMSEIIKELSEEVEANEEAIEEPTAEDTIEEPAEAEEAEEEAIEADEADEEEANAEEEAEASEEVEESEIEETSEEGSDEEEAEEDLTAVAESIDKLQEANKNLTEQVETLKKEKRNLQKKLKTKNEEISKFSQKFKGLSISMGLSNEAEEEKKETVEKTALYKNGGIGEL